MRTKIDASELESASPPLRCSVCISAQFGLIFSQFPGLQVSFLCQCMLFPNAGVHLKELVPPPKPFSVFLTHISYMAKVRTHRHTHTTFSNPCARLNRGAAPCVKGE